MWVIKKRDRRSGASLSFWLRTPTQAFDVLREEQPHVFEKVYPVVGDVSHEKLGLSDDDQAFLVENTDVVFHLAATIRFDAPLR